LRALIDSVFFIIVVIEPVLLIFDSSIFIPESFTENRVCFPHRGITELAKHNTVTLTIIYILGDRDYGSVGRLLPITHFSTLRV
jgi:hypothetical protein